MEQIEVAATLEYPKSISSDEAFAAAREFMEVESGIKLHSFRVEQEVTESDKIHITFGHVTMSEDDYVLIEDDYDGVYENEHKGVLILIELP